MFYNRHHFLAVIPRKYLSLGITYNINLKYQIDNRENKFFKKNYV